MTTASSAVTLGTTAPTLSDSAVLAGGYYETGSLVFTLSGPGGFSYTQTDPLSGNGTYTASDTLPTTGNVAGNYTWSVFYQGDANNNSAFDQGGTAEQTVVSKANPTITTTPSPAITLGTTAPTLSDSAVLANGYYETGNLVFTLNGPGGQSYTHSDLVTGNGTYTPPARRCRPRGRWPAPTRGRSATPAMPTTIVRPTRAARRSRRWSARPARRS